ncbi:hypothetical protein GWK47_030805 [Chionoecetes opilio]|uniref:Uncharacterized protein n=1 Tax=Chionoecetes opilio TaxID=41210 RepID=A0A8J4YLE2_CHIOP|nr:hypothetical protein GWK47_030805 [Chionoecetes opilio]
MASGVSREPPCSPPGTIGGGKTGGHVRSKKRQQPGRHGMRLSTMHGPDLTSLTSHSLARSWCGPGRDGTQLLAQTAILALVNCAWLVGCLPSGWKAPNIQPIPKPKEPAKPVPISMMSAHAKTAEVVITALQASKALFTQAELRQHAQRGIAEANVPGSAVYYT